MCPSLLNRMRACAPQHAAAITQPTPAGGDPFFGQDCSFERAYDYPYVMESIQTASPQNSVVFFRACVHLTDPSITDAIWLY